MTYPKQDSLAQVVEEIIELLYSQDRISGDQYRNLKDRLWFLDKKERSTIRSSRMNRSPREKFGDPRRRIF
jgi:hypothetical protein